MDLNQAIELAKAHAWVALAALVIGAVVRAIKSDKIPIDIPARWRPMFVLALGVLSGALESNVAGTPLVTALVGGLFSAAVASLGHGTLIEGLRAGRELGESKAEVPALPGGKP